MPWLRFGQHPAEQPEADSGDPGQQCWGSEHGAVGGSGGAAERLVCAAAHGRGARQGALSAPAQRRLVLRLKHLGLGLAFGLH